MSNRYAVLPDRAIIAISGTDNRSFLQGIITQNIDSVTPDHSVYGAMLNAQGKYLCDFFLVQHEDAIWLECDERLCENLLRLLNLYRLRADVSITTLTKQYHVLAALGSADALSLPATAGRTEHFHADAILAFIDPRMAKMGARVLAPVGEGETWLQERGLGMVPFEEYEQHRLQLGIPNSTEDNLPEKTLLMENGFEELHGVDFNKGCYVGQEVTARTKHRANLRKRLYCVRTDEASLPEAGTEIMQEERKVGDMRSSQGGYGLAVIRDDALEKDAQLTAEGVALHISQPAWRNV